MSRALTMTSYNGIVLINDVQDLFGAERSQLRVAGCKKISHIAFNLIRSI